MAATIRTLAAVSLASLAASTPAFAALPAWLEPPLPWNVWLGLASALVLVVALVLAFSRRRDGGDGDVYRFDRPRRGPMPLYEEGSSG